MDFLYLLPTLIATVFATYIALIDIREFRIPNQVLVPALLITVTSMLFASLIHGDPLRLAGAMIGGLLSLLAFFAIHLLNPAGLGMGDVKLAFLIGGTLSWIAFPMGLLGLGIAFIALAIFTIIQAIFRRGRMSRILPFAPFLLFGLLFVELGLLI